MAERVVGTGSFGVVFQVVIFIFAYLYDMNSLFASFFHVFVDCLYIFYAM